MNKSFIIILLFFSILFSNTNALTYDLNFSTYIGGSDWEQARDVVADDQGNIYVVGYTASSDFPTTPGAYDRTFDTSGTQIGGAGYADGYVMKFDQTGQLIWSTYLGGPNFEVIYGIEVDNQGYVYVAGQAGPGFPTTAGAFQPTFQGSDHGIYGMQNVFVAKLKPDGSDLVWASYVGTSWLSRDLDIDTNGDVYVSVGYTGSGTSPSQLNPQWYANAFQKTPQGGEDAGVVKIKSDGSQVLWATYLGGSGVDYQEASVRVDAGGHAYIALQTRSSDIPTTLGAHDRTINGGVDFYVAKLAADGSSLLWGTYLGDSGDNHLNTHNLALDAQGNAYVTVSTAASDFPTTSGALQRAFAGGTDIGLAKLSSAAGALMAGTYLGGSGGDGSDGIYVDNSGNVYLSVGTQSADFPVTSNAYQPAYSGNGDAVFVKLSSDFSDLLYATYLGGGSNDEGRTGYLTSDGSWILSGQSSGSGFPAVNAYQDTYAGGTLDAILAKFTYLESQDVTTTTTTSITTTTTTSSTTTILTTTSSTIIPTSTSTTTTPSSTTIVTTTTSDNPPQWFNLRHNPLAVFVGQVVDILVDWIDDEGIQKVIISENSTGVWVNHTVYDGVIVTTTSTSTITSTSSTTSITTTTILTGAPVIQPITVQTSGSIPKYDKYEISFDIDTVATNPYFPYDPSPPAGVEVGTGITVDMLLLAPGEADWNNAKTLPCFYYQPSEEVGSGSNIALLPVGPAEWRCRFTPDIVGNWQYKIKATDAQGTSESSVYQFTVIDSNNKGFIEASETDTRFFEFSDGTPFITPLTSMERAYFNTLAEIRSRIPTLGEGAIRFVRWFPTGEGANFFVAPFSDWIKIVWHWVGGSTLTDPDTASGKIWSFLPGYHTAQMIPAVPGDKYRLSFRAEVTGEKVLRAEFGDHGGNLGSIDIGSTESTYHENVNGETLTYKQDGWHDYVLEGVNSASTLGVYLRGLYTSGAPSPYDKFDFPDWWLQRIKTHSIKLQRDETGNGDWGPNLLSRSDPDTYNYVDQRSATRLDEILRLSEQYGVYHKLTMFHKNDNVLNVIQQDGSISIGWAQYNGNFYASPAAVWYENAYTRYFIGRWSYSTSLHSLELANENSLRADSYKAGFDFAEQVHNTSPRHILVTNSFWGYFADPQFADPDRGHLIDYGDKHWYANTDSGNVEIISRTWQDSAAYVRECWIRFNEYKNTFNYQKPIVRGEGGVAQSGTGPQHPEIQTDPKGTYYHKKLWAHVGTLGYTCDGEWYPRVFKIAYDDTHFPNDNYNLPKMFNAYENFVEGEPLNNGNYEVIGTDQPHQISLSQVTGNIRAWGSRDAIAGKILLWIDNADHTWKNVVDGVTINPISATLTFTGFQPGADYILEWWDTHQPDPALQVISSETITPETDGSIILNINSLTTDIAVKIYPQSPLSGALQFSASGYSANEAGGSITIDVTRSTGRNGVVTVDYATSDGTAIESSDYNLASGTLNWIDNDTDTKSFTVDIIDNLVPDASKTINLTLSNPTGAAVLGALDTALLTIIDNENIDPSLVAHWKFDDGSGTQAIDSSGNGNDGTISGATWVTGHYGVAATALSFDGSNDYIDLGDVFDFDYTDSWTVSAWINANSLTPHSFSIITKQRRPSPYDGWGLKLLGQKLRFTYIYSVSPSNRLSVMSTNNVVTQTGRWYHVSLVYSNKVVTMYIDGIEVPNTVGFDTLSSNVDNVISANIGGRDNDGGRADEDFNGIIDDVRIYNRALSAQEVALLAGG